MDPAPYASSPCMLGDEAETRRDVMRWRKAERQRLIAARQAMPVAMREAAQTRIAEQLSGEQGRVIALYWPFRAEPDLRPWAEAQRHNGAQLALPVVVEKAQPLVFRLWSPEFKLVRGVWDILHPPDDAPELLPDLVLSPVVGVDPQGYRLGYGGGFYDRTLAALRDRGRPARVIGVGFRQQAIPTIFPLSHDIAMDRVILA